MNWPHQTTLSGSFRSIYEGWGARQWSPPGGMEKLKKQKWSRVVGICVLNHDEGPSLLWKTMQKHSVPGAQDKLSTSLRR